MMNDAALAADGVLLRNRLTIRGLVQGVGFRPFVHQLANRYALTGFVGNDDSGVFLEIQGTTTRIAAFEAELTSRPPPLSRIDAIKREQRPTLPETHFVIVPSETSTQGVSSVPADVGVCRDCLSELSDPADRRFRYPFLNCTHCGPRFTVIRGLPYDRCNTTMSGFAMCTECDKEYRDPADRRFHAQPIACPECGPNVWLEVAGEVVATRNQAIGLTIERLATGGIIAVKGIGGFHLACDARDSHAVRKLRERKGRGDKPFAVMTPDLEAARRCAIIDEDEARLLSGPQRPIVLLRKSQDNSPLANEVAPGTNTIGVMLPYSPLHYLLMTDRPLVMTSGNHNDEPIARDNESARASLQEMADALLMHDRDIHTVCDDSVIRVFEGREYPIRRSRGYAPLPIRLPRTCRPVLAVGGELKATLCATVGDHAILSQHLGDVESPETLAAFDRAAEHLLDLFRVRPEAIVCDRHPGYLSADWAKRFSAKIGVPLVRVQHHRTHAASLLADAGRLNDSVLVVCFDGTGYGDDGAIWGGEFLAVNQAGSRRVGHLNYVPLPGGDAAIRRPYRIALAHLWASGVPWHTDFPCVSPCTTTDLRVFLRQLERNIGCVPTSSMGRLFDTVASLIGVRQVVSYEGQAAIELEATANEDWDEPYPFPLRVAETIQLDPAPLIAAIAADVCGSVPMARIATRFHVTVADAIVRVAMVIRGRDGLEIVGLTGGVFQNLRLLSTASTLLRSRGFEVLAHHQVPANDGGLALGQAVIASGWFSGG